MYSINSVDTFIYAKYDNLYIYIFLESIDGRWAILIGAANFCLSSLFLTVLFSTGLDRKLRRLRRV